MIGFILFYLYIVIIFFFLVFCSIALPKYCQQKNYSATYFYGVFYIFNLVCLIYIFGISGGKTILLNFMLLIVSHFFGLKLRVFIITGQPRAGKSWIGEYLSKRFKAKLINADEILFECVKSSEFSKILRERLKDKILDDNDSLDYVKFRKLLINDEKMFEIITNMVKTRFLMKLFFYIIKEKFINQKKYVFIESNHFLKFPQLRIFFYPIFGIYTNISSQLVRRLMDYFNVDKLEAEKIYNKQYSPQELQMICDFNFINDSTLDVVQRQVDKLMSLLKLS
jgi:dephospho-CoA kinase